MEWFKGLHHKEVVEGGGVVSAGSNPFLFFSLRHKSWYFQVINFNCPSRKGQQNSYPLKQTLKNYIIVKIKQF